MIRARDCDSEELQPEVNRGGEMAHRFEIVREIRRQYRRFNTTGTQLTVRLNPLSSTDANPIDHFLASVNDVRTRSAGRGRRGHGRDRYS